VSVTDPTTAARAALAAQTHRARAWAKALALEGRDDMRALTLDAIGKGREPRDVLARALLDHMEACDGARPFAIVGSLHRWHAGNWYSVPYRELSMAALAAFDGLAGCRGNGDAIGVADRVLVIAARQIEAFIERADEASAEMEAA
jgi:hypothetical protein